jgi:hypothetical protein
MDTTQRARNRTRRTYILFHADEGDCFALVRLAEEACTSVTALVEDILSVPENQTVIDQLWEDYGRELVVQAESDAGNRDLLRALILDEEDADRGIAHGRRARR